MMSGTSRVSALTSLIIIHTTWNTSSNRWTTMQFLSNLWTPSLTVLTAWWTLKTSPQPTTWRVCQLSVCRFHSSGKLLQLKYMNAALYVLCSDLLLKRLTKSRPKTTFQVAARAKSLRSKTKIKKNLKQFSKKTTIAITGSTLTASSVSRVSQVSKQESLKQLALVLPVPTKRMVTS